MSKTHETNRWIKVVLKFKVPKVSPQDVGWREALDGIRGAISRTFYGKEISEHVEAR